jgi:hypothetical protein
MPKKTKICTGCHKRKSIDEFGSHKGQGDGTNSRCRDCTRKYHRELYNRSEKYRISSLNYKKNHPDGIKLWAKKQYYKRKYKLTLEQLQQKLESQLYRCEICGREIKESFHTDHNHKTGQVRGMLCCKCNLSVGLIEDKEFSEKIFSYLEKYNNGNSI